MDIAAVRAPNRVIIGSSKIEYFYAEDTIIDYSNIAWPDSRALNWQNSRYNWIFYIYIFFNNKYTIIFVFFTVCKGLLLHARTQQLQSSSEDNEIRRDSKEVEKGSIFGSILPTTTIL